jgi:hypothetical protein
MISIQINQITIRRYRTYDIGSRRQAVMRHDVNGGPSKRGSFRKLQGFQAEIDEMKSATASVGQGSCQKAASGSAIYSNFRNASSAK